MPPEDTSPIPPEPRKGSIRDIGIVRPPSVDQAEKLKEAVLHAKEKKLDDQLKPLKTYQSDVSEAIKRDNVSVIKMALAEKKRQEAEGLTKQAVVTDSKKASLFFVLSAALIVAGIALIVYFSFFHSNNQGSVVGLPQNLIYAEKNTELKLDKADPAVLISGVGKTKQSSRPAGTIENLLLTETDVGTSTREVGARHLITGSRLVTLLDTRIPAPLFRSIQDPYMLGIYQPQSTPSSEVFMILKSDSYDIAYAGMLEWEGTLKQDMTPLFSIPQNFNAAPSGTASTTASSSASSSSQPFKDRLIQNRDTRVLTDQSGKVVFLYSFVDPNTIIFTQSEEAFKEIVGRYLESRQEK